MLFACAHLDLTIGEHCQVFRDRIGRHDDLLPLQCRVWLRANMQSIVPSKYKGHCREPHVNDDFHYKVL